MVQKLGIDKRILFEDLSYKPHPGQQAVHDSTAPRRVVACGVRWGKTVCAAMEGLAAALVPSKSSIGWVVAPTYDLADRVWRQIQVTVYEHLRHRVVMMREHDRRLVLRNLGGGESEIRAKSADNPVSLLGEGLDWLIVDEAARLKPAIWQSHLAQRLIDKRGWALLISTPKGKGYFFDLYRRGQGDDPHYASWNMPSWGNPLLDPTLIEEERGRLPERVFAQEFGGQFLEGAGQVFRYIREAATGSFQAPKEGERYYAGLDLAKVQDFTVLVILNRAHEVVFVDRFHRLDWQVQVSRIQGALERYGNALVSVDSTGKGEPIFEALSRAGCRAEAYSFTARSKADLVNYLALQFEHHEMRIPRYELCPEMVEELESFEYEVGDTGHVRTGAPAGQHDDCVIALALAAWQRNRPRPFMLFGDL